MDVLLAPLPWAFVLGLLVGSFLNVVILRLPPRLMHGWRHDAREMLELAPDAEFDKQAPADLVWTRSHCPRCNRQLAAWENIPLVSFVLLRGRCRSCQAPISWQYPAVETLTAVATAIVVYRYGLSPQGLVAVLASWMLIAAAVIDARTTLLPDQLTLPLLWLALLASAYGLFRDPASAIFGAAVGYLSLWSIYWAFRLLTGKEGMGFGDFKLLAALGAFVGVKGLLPIVLFASFFGAIIGGIFLAVRGRDRATPIPFGPFLATAGWIQIVFERDWLAEYLRFVGM